jgi:hypothetical protein
MTPKETPSRRQARLLVPWEGCPPVGREVRLEGVGCPLGREVCRHLAVCLLPKVCRQVQEVLAKLR